MAGNFSNLLRGSLWVLSHAIPDPQALRKPVRMALAGIALAAAAGSLLAIALVAGLVGLYMYLGQSGVTPGADLAIVLGAGVVAIGFGYLLMRKWVGELPTHVHALYHPPGSLSDVVQQVVGGFFDGFSRKAERAAEETDDAIDDAIASLLKRLEALEEAKEHTDEVVLDLQRTKRNPRKH